MTSDPRLAAVDVTAALTLAVGWISGQRTKIRQVTVSQEVAEEFRRVVRDTLNDLASRDGEVWAPDAELSPETYLHLDATEVGDAPLMAAEHQGLSLVDALRAAESLPDLHPAQLPAGDLSFYAITIGNEPGSRSVFLRRSNPRRGLKRGRIYSVFSDTLHRIEEPIFAFDEWMDLVVVESEMFVLSQTVFAALFRSQDALAAQVPVWTSQLKEVVPISELGATRLQTRAQRDSRIRARLEAIVRRGHLTSVPAKRIRKALLAAELDPDLVLNSEGEFTLEDDDIAPVLYFSTLR